MAAIHQISSDIAPILNATLPPIQNQVVAALATGQTVTAAAREAGIHRTTIHHWLRTEPNFKTQREYLAALDDEMRELSARALATLRSLLDDPAAPPSVRLRAALAVLERPKFPDQGWSLPERIETPREQQVVDIFAEMKAGERALRMTASTPAEPPEPSGQQPPATAHRPLFPPETSGPHYPQPTTHHPPSRCAPCPCGSGLKYKRCCGSASAAVIGKALAA